MAYTHAYEYPFCKLSRDRFIRYIHYAELVRLGWSLWDNMGVCTLGYLIFNGSRQCVSNYLCGLWCQGYGQKLNCCIYTCNILTKLLIMSSYYVGLILQNYVCTHTQTQTTYTNMEVLLSASAIGLPIFDYNQSNCVDSPPVYHLRQWEIRTWEGINSSIHEASMHRCQSNCRSTVGLRLTHRAPHRNLALWACDWKVARN